MNFGFRYSLRRFLIKEGYTHTQADQLMGKLVNQGLIGTWISTYGPNVLNIFRNILPLFTAAQQPAHPTKAKDYIEFNRTELDPMN